MILTIVLGLITTLLGVVFGCTVLELAVRAMGHGLAAEQPKAVSKNRVGRLTMSGRYLG